MSRYLFLAADDGLIRLRIPRTQQVQTVEDHIRVVRAEPTASPLDVRHDALNRSADVLHLNPRSMKGRTR